MEGASISLTARMSMLDSHLGESLIRDSGRGAFFDENIEEFKNFSIALISKFLKEKIQDFFDE